MRPQYSSVDDDQLRCIERIVSELCLELGIRDHDVLRRERLIRAILDVAITGETDLIAVKLKALQPLTH